MRKRPEKGYYSRLIKPSTEKKRRRSKFNHKTAEQFFDCERILAKRSRPSVGDEYLVVWSDYPISQSSWQLSECLTAGLRRDYLQPSVCNSVVHQEVNRLLYKIAMALKQPGRAYFSVEFRGDVFRKLFGSCGVEPPADMRAAGGMLAYKKDAFSQDFFPAHFWYAADSGGQGRAVEFPVLMKHRVTKVILDPFHKTTTFLEEAFVDFNKVVVDFNSQTDAPGDGTANATATPAATKELTQHRASERSRSPT